MTIVAGLLLFAYFGAHLKCVEEQTQNKLLRERERIVTRIVGSRQCVAVWQWR